MRIGRTLPPAAAPLSGFDLLNGIMGAIKPEIAIEFLQHSISTEFNKKHCFLVSSGKAAITLTLRALSEISPDRNEVIIPVFNCYSVPSAIIRAGLIVHPCDIDPLTLQLQEEALLSILKSSAKILAIIPTHLFGLPANTDHIRELSKSTGITIIEDAAQAMGSKYKGKFLGTEGDVGIFSLARGKALSAGEGGIILTDSDILAEKVYEQMSIIPGYSSLQLLNLAVQSIALTLLIHPMFFWIPKMMPFLKLGETIFDPDFPIRKFSGFQAGLMKNWKSKLNKFIKERLKRTALYSNLLSHSKNIWILPNKWQGDSPSYIRFPIIIRKEMDVLKILKESELHGLGISKSYPDTIDSINQISLHKISPSINALNVTRTLLTLPCHSFVSNKDIIKIVEVIKLISNE
jgi:perosamine synthetase